MKICKILLITSFAIALTKESLAGKMLDMKTTDYGNSWIEENIANPEMPEHVIVFKPQDGSSLAGELFIGCREVEFEIFYHADNSNFFSGNRLNLKARFNSENKSSNISTSRSTNSKSAFITSTISFISNFIKEGSVVISGDYYSGRFAALYKIDETMLDEIYKLADRCRIKSKIPKINEATFVKSMIKETNQTSNLPDKDRQLEDKTLISELSELISKYGLKNVKDKIYQIENSP